MTSLLGMPSSVLCHAFLARCAKLARLLGRGGKVFYKNKNWGHPLPSIMLLSNEPE